MLKESSVTRTSVIRSPALGSEVLIPCLQALLLVLPDQPLDPPQLMTRKAEIERDLYRCKPKFCRHILTVDVNVGRLPSIVTREIDSVRTFNPDTWHAPSVPRRP